MKNLNSICKAYLKKNGITSSFCADWCGCSKAVFSMWLSGQRKLPKEAEDRVLLFMRGDFLTPLGDIVKVIDADPE